MKDEDILKIAMQCDPEFTRRTYYLDLLNFGAAVAAAERERCANICDHERGTAGDAADKIRMLSNAKSQATDAALSRQVACTDGLGLGGSGRSGT